MVRKISILVALAFFITLFFFPVISHAKKRLPARTAGTVSGVATSVKFRSDRRAIIVSFSNIKTANSIDYMLSYNTRGTTQGAAGSLNPATSGNFVSRELLFGTCSHGVCRYDTGITNAKFVITIALSNGKKIIRTYSIRIK